MIFGMWVVVDDTKKQGDFGPPSAFFWYCSKTSCFDISCSEHAVVVIFEWQVALVTENKWCRFGPPSSLNGTAGGVSVSDFEPSYLEK